METTKVGGHMFFAQIDPINDPIELFTIWRNEAMKFQIKGVDYFCLATISGESKVSARNLLLREFDNQGFVIMTEACSRKVNDMQHNPHAAMCFLWTYKNDVEQNIVRQVRIEGSVIELEKSAYQHIYDREPLYCKIRSHLCHQDQPANLDILNRQYSEILVDVCNNGAELPMPSHTVAYKILPETMEFYQAWDELIADRIHFSKKESSGSWKYQRITA